MVQGVVVGVTERNAVVVVVATHEGHDLGAVRQREVQHLLQKLSAGLNVVAVEYHMGQAHGLICFFGGA